MAVFGPSLLLFAVFVVLPVLAAFGISFAKWDLFTEAHWAGLDNYRQLLFEDQLFHKVMKNTFVYVIGTVPVQMILAFFVALLLNRGVWGQNALRVIYFLPVVSSTVAVALIWSWIFNSDFGVLNALLSAVGVQDLPGWLNSSKYALPALIIVAIWQGLGYPMVLFLAGLQGVSREAYEAGEIDGAVGWRKHLYITLPLLSPTTFFVAIVSLRGCSALVLSIERTEWVVTNGPALQTADDVRLALVVRWAVEVFHRELKQVTGIEGCQCRLGRSQRNHIGRAMLVWIRLAQVAREAKKTTYALKFGLLDDYMRQQLANPSVSFA